MISVSSSTKIYVHTKPVDFRKGIDGFASICKSELALDPFSGSMFVFTNKLRSALKILYYDGQGFWIYHKRLSRGKFKWWPSGKISTSIAAKDLAVLVWNGNPEESKMQSDWR